jgi:hypothetical protein
MSHLIDPALLRADKFEAFMPDRQKRLLGLIEQATGKARIWAPFPKRASMWRLTPMRSKPK